MPRGRFISLEGGEAVGKSTQATRLATALRTGGREVVLTREPGGSTGAEAIRALLLNGAEDRWGARAEALLFAAARADHVERLIRPALARGAWVVCDRFVDSSRAYQGGADGIGDAAILALHDIGSEGLLPDRTLLLSLDGSQAGVRERRRDGDAADRFGLRNNDFKNAVQIAFERLAAAEPARFAIIDGSGELDVVTQRLLAALEDLL